MMKFDLPKEESSIIKVIGIGGGGGNAVNHMYQAGIKGVEFLVCNTDSQALDSSPVPMKVQLGAHLTEGRGAGSMPEIGRNSAIENLDDIKEALGNNTKMVFITAGMGGGTGTGAAPVIAKMAKDMGVLTVGIVTIPFAFEGKKRQVQALKGIEELKQNVDTLLVICNDKLREIHGDLKLTEAFGHADDILSTAARSIAEVITVTGYINVDFADVYTVMNQSGVAIMGNAYAEGDDRAIAAAKRSLDSPLLNDNQITGARYILLNISSGQQEITMDEIGEITDYIQGEAGQTADIIMGTGIDESLENKISVTVIATGFQAHEQNLVGEQEPQRVVRSLDDDVDQEHESPAEIKPVQTEIKLKPEEPLKEEPKIVAEVKPIEPEPELSPDFTFDIPEDSEIEKPKAEQEDFTYFDLNEDYADKLEEPKQEDPIDAEPEIKEEKKEDNTKENIQFEITNLNDKAKTGEIEFPVEDQYKRSRERIQKLKEISYRLNQPGGLNDLEKEPAYKRRNVELNNVPESKENEVSRHTLSDEGDNQAKIKKNNSFLHDKVD